MRERAVAVYNHLPHNIKLFLLFLIKYVVMVMLITIRGR